MTREELAEELEKAYRAGYRSGYLNGRQDQEYGEEHDADPGEGFALWLSGADGPLPFPGLVGLGPWP